MANVLMTFAEYERQVIGARVKDAYDKLVRDGKYTGGMVPFGYKPVKLGKGWGVEVDPEYGPLVAEMADRYLRYETLGSIARWLQESGVPSPKDVIRKRNGKPMTGTPWTTAAVRIILRSHAVLGAVTNANGEPLRDSQGVVVYRDLGRHGESRYRTGSAEMRGDPRKGQEAVDDVARIAALGLKGVKFHPSLQAFAPDDERYWPVFEACERHRLLALFHTGTSGIGAGSPAARASGSTTRTRSSSTRWRRHSRS